MLKVGDILDNKYKILNKIGQGGMSTVYLAMNEKANKQWAIKEVRKQGEENFGIVKQALIVETELLKTLKNKYLPAIADIIEDEDTLIIVMDYIEGRTLSDILEEQKTIAQDKAVHYAVQLCEVLSYLHSQDPPIIYRDLKPSNIMIKPDDTITLIDFGTARRYNSSNIADTTCLGTRGYAAPEQYEGADSRQTDARTDIYNLGATLYHILTGRNPAKPPYEIKPIRDWDVSLSSGLEKIVLKCTNKDPEKRFRNCVELKQALENYTHLDDMYLKKQKRKIAIFAFNILIMSMSLFSIFFFVNKIKYEDNFKYNDYLREAATQISLTYNDSDINSDIVDTYRKAIEVDAHRSEAYIRLLDYYISKGQTKNGILAISAMISSGNGNLIKNSDILYKMGMLYFLYNANNEDIVDYEIAYGYLSKVDTKLYPRAEYYTSIAEALSSIEIDWNNLLEKLYILEDSLNSIEDEEEKINTYLTLANIYRNNALAIDEVGVNAYLKAIEILNKGQDLLQSNYIDKDIAEKYMGQFKYYLADSLYRAGLKSDKKDEDLLISSIDYYREYLEYIDADEGLTYKNRIGDIYRQLGKYDKAQAQYESIIEAYPNNELAYISYTSMLLNDLKRIDKATEIYNKMKTLEGIENNRNFKAIENKIEALTVGGNNG